MNERIRKLIRNLDNKLGRYYWTDEEKEKFAELIVRESIVDFYRRYLDLESEEDITEQVNRYVKDNFGVEE
jgi:hypothetical protein